MTNLSLLGHITSKEQWLRKYHDALDEVYQLSGFLEPKDQLNILLLVAVLKMGLKFAYMERIKK